MSTLVKLVGQGIGLAAEAKQHRKDKKAREANSIPGTPPLAFPDAELSRSSSAPPVYAELPPDEANALIASGDAVAVDRREDSDEKDWELDDAAEEVDPEDEQRTQKESNDAFAVALARLPPPDPTRKLPCPVILPQRRPRAKARGFVRAYAPVLMESGIDQEAFLAFMAAWEKGSKASPVLDIIMIGAAIAGFAPSAVAMVTSTVIQVAVGVAKEVQSRKRRNSFLDDANEKLFMPRGLYCMIMKFDPEKERPVSSSEVNINDSIAKYTAGASNKLKSSLRVASGKTYGEVEMPEAAPLIYPAIDHALDDPDAEKPNAFKRGGEFFNDYRDRRAQAEYIDQNPGSKLVTQPRPQFASVYSDPSHPANSGSVLALLTKGKIQGPPSRRDGGRRGGPLHALVGELTGKGREEQGGGLGGGLGALVSGLTGKGREEQGGQQYGGQYGGQESGYIDGNQHESQFNPARPKDRHGREVSGSAADGFAGRRGRGGVVHELLGNVVGKDAVNGGPKGVVKRIMRQDVLYLLIVNLPSDQEIAEARERIGMGG